jgi:hypothetical protein
MSASTEIRESRRNAWVKVEYRAHQIARVYAQSDRDFLFIGDAQMRTRKGYAFKEEFIGRAIVDNPNSPSPRLEHFNVWIVSLSLFFVIFLNVILGTLAG